MGDAGDQDKVNGRGPAARANGEPTDFNVKAGLAKMLKGGVIMDVVNAEQVSRSSVDTIESHAHRLVLPKKRAHAQSWRLKECQPI